MKIDSPLGKELGLGHTSRSDLWLSTHTAPVTSRWGLEGPERRGGPWTLPEQDSDLGSSWENLPRGRQRTSVFAGKSYDDREDVVAHLRLTGETRPGALPLSFPALTPEVTPRTPHASLLPHGLWSPLLNIDDAVLPPTFLFPNRGHLDTLHLGVTQRPEGDPRRLWGPRSCPRVRSPESCPCVDKRRETLEDQCRVSTYQEEQGPFMVKM